jgi:NADH:ubiquinone oxidoreductase subunit 2 (subunit N)
VNGVPSFFPQTTIEWRMEEPAAFRRLSLSLPEMALITGVVVRLLRALLFTPSRASWILFGILLLAAVLLVLGMTTAHLANFPVRAWSWRAPLFALVEVLGEMVTSLGLIAIRREPEGTARAAFHDCLWALLLAAVIIFARQSGLASDVDTDPLDAAPTAPPARES